jgi:hypothetical protein
MTQPLSYSYPFAHESGHIPASLLLHMNMPIFLLGHMISRIASSQVIHTNMVTQVTQHPSHPSQVIPPYIGGQSSMGLQPSTRGKPSVAGKPFTRGKPTWLQHQQASRKATSVIHSIHTTTILYLGHLYPRVLNPLWAQLNPTGISPQGTMPYQSINPMISMQYSLQSQYMGGPSCQPHHIRGLSGQFQYVGGPFALYMGGKIGQPPYMGGKPEQPPYMGGPSKFSILPQLGYGPIGVPMQYGYHRYQQHK